MHNIWLPYTDMTSSIPERTVRSGEGVYLHLDNKISLIDGISSWWSVIHGYNHPKLNGALQKQIEKISHVMLGGVTHEPVIQLAEKLIQITPSSLNHVFFSDSGSTGVEVALKMALQYWKNKNQAQKNKFIALKKGYHGDTLGAMSVSDPEEGMHSLFSDILPRHFFINPPSKDQATKSLDELGGLLKAQGSTIAGIILEPLLQAAGGFNIYNPSYLIEIKKLCALHGVLCITDEVATGFGRTGTLFAVNQAPIDPDIMILGKGLTGGYLGMAATLASTEIFTSFFHKSPFMHGPTFMGNPLACKVALKSIEIFEEERYLLKIARIEAQLKAELLPIQHPDILDTRVLGAMGVIEVQKASVLEGFQDFAVKEGVWLRPFGRYLYTMPAYIMTEEELTKVIRVMKDWFYKEKRDV